MRLVGFAVCCVSCAPLFDAPGAAPTNRSLELAAQAPAPPPRAVAPTGAPVTIVERPSERDDAAVRALSASADANRIVSESRDLSSPSGATSCKVAGLDALCFKGREGPLLVTDIVGASACSDRLFIGSRKAAGDYVDATERNTEFGFHWLIEAHAAAVTGARFVVRGGEWLNFAIVAGKGGYSGSAECQITWSGFRPWIVPGMTAGGDGSEWQRTMDGH